MKQIYNEGRVVGLSAHELYVRELLSLNPEATPMTERAWLTSTLANNSSMILRIPAGTEVGYHDYVLPVTSDLCAATVIYGSLFLGEVSLSEDGYWARSVLDYGPLISNTDERHPVTPGNPEDVPAKKKKPKLLTEETWKKCNSYLNVVSALIIQPGDWDEVYYPPVYTPPGIDPPEPLPAPSQRLEPNLAGTPFVRVLVAEEIETDILILLHGFTYKSILKGELGFIYKPESEIPENGDFLGPAMFPWSCPVELLITNDVETAITYQTNHKLKILEKHIKYLESLHTVLFPTELTDEESNWLLTEDEEVLLAQRAGTIVEMWEQMNEDDIVFIQEEEEEEEPPVEEPDDDEDIEENPDEEDDTCCCPEGCKYCDTEKRRNCCKPNREVLEEEH